MPDNVVWVEASTTLYHFGKHFYLASGAPGAVRRERGLQWGDRVLGLRCGWEESY